MGKAHFYCLLLSLIENSVPIIEKTTKNSGALRMFHGIITSHKPFGPPLASTKGIRIPKANNKISR